ncbi:hypothetical protein JL09_g6877, partial [Pichia kudriavzevii]
PDNVSAFKFN